MGDDLNTPSAIADQPVHDAALPLTPDAATPAAEPDEPEVLEIPTGEKLVPLSALQSARDKIKAEREEKAALKAEADRAKALAEEKSRLEQALNQALPLAQAYQAALSATQTQPASPDQTQGIPDAEAEKWARRYDLYSPDGSGRYDLARGREIAADMRATAREEARRAAEDVIAPIQQQTVQDRAAFMLERAMITKGADGAQPDPQVLQTVWRSVDPRITATPEGAAQVWAVALGYSAAVGAKPRGADGRFVAGQPAAPAAPLPPPLVTEPAGGREMPVQLDAADRKLAREMGMSEKEYAETAAKMPWRNA